MSEALRQLLEVDYQYAVEAQVVDDKEAQIALEAGDMPTYFDLSLHMQLADVCWALEKWDEAKHWYRHNAHVLMERRLWRAQHLTPESRTEGLLDWEASTFVKAGDLQAGREYLQRAVAYWRDRPDSDLKLTELGLHAAQAGLPDLAANVSSIVRARQDLAGGNGPDAGQVRQLLHYEFAEVNLLLGRWDDFRADTEVLKQGIQLAEKCANPAFPEPLQAALVAASRGLQTLALLQDDAIDRKKGRQEARQAFEEAMLNFYRFTGQIDWDLYFMRLSSRLADDLAAGRAPDVNPFAGP